MVSMHKCFKVGDFANLTPEDAPGPSIEEIRRVLHTMTPGERRAQSSQAALLQYQIDLGALRTLQEDLDFAITEAEIECGKAVALHSKLTREQRLSQARRALNAVRATLRDFDRIERAMLNGIEEVNGALRTTLEVQASERSAQQQAQP